MMMMMMMMMMMIWTSESLGYYEMKQYKPKFDEECSKLSDQRKEAKL
jgi:hypothetical protein